MHKDVKVLDMIDAKKLNDTLNKMYKKISDEYLPPLKTQYSSIINRGDVLFFANFSKIKRTEFYY